MRSFQVLLAGSNPATRLISSFYLIPNAFLCEEGTQASKVVQSTYLFFVLFVLRRRDTKQGTQASKEKQKYAKLVFLSSHRRDTKSCYFFFCMLVFFLVCPFFFKGCVPYRRRDTGFGKEKRSVLPSRVLFQGIQAKGKGTGHTLKKKGKHRIPVRAASHTSSEANLFVTFKIYNN